MATRTNRVEVEITATDQATPTIDRLEKKIDGLEADEARITVTANTERLQRQLDDARTKLEGLDGDQATVQARLVGNLETQLEQADALFKQLDGKTGTVRINAVDKATGDLRKVRDEVGRLDGATASVRTNVSGIVGGVAGGIGLAGLATILFDAAQNAGQLALQVQQVADLTGASLDDASRLVGIFANNGVEASDLLDMILQVNQTLQQSPELADQLGITDSTDLIDLFVQSVDKIGPAFDDAGARGVASSQLFGEEGVRQVQAVKTAIDTDLADALDQFSGPIVTDEAVENARKVNTEMAEAKQSIMEISLQLLPAVNGALNALAAYFNAVGNAGEATGNWWRDHPRLSGTELLNAIGGFVSPDQGPRMSNLPAGINTGGAPRVTIINPPGTPAATADQARLYDQRNGARS